MGVYVSTFDFPCFSFTSGNPLPRPRHLRRCFPSFSRSGAALASNACDPLTDWLSTAFPAPLFDRGICPNATPPLFRMLPLSALDASSDHSGVMLPLEDHPGAEKLCHSEQEAPANANLFTDELPPNSTIRAQPCSWTLGRLN